MNWPAHGSWARRLLVALAVGAAIALSPLPASGGIAWDAGIWTGYAALILAATLYLYPLRGDGLPHRRLFTLSHHRRIGWAALALGAVHTAILLTAQPLTTRYLLPSAPLYMLSGVAALIALMILVPTGLSARSTLRQAPTRMAFSLSSHIVLALLLLALIGAHVIGSHQLIDSRVKILTICSLLAIPLLWTALRGLRREGPRRLTTTIPGCAAAAMLLLLPLPTASPRLLEPATTPAVLPIHFPHEKHTTVNCVICHHNFVDKTGIGSCVDCHRQARPDLELSLEATFHTFCRDCHTELAQTTLKHGPTRSCSACHLKPAATG